MLEDKTPTNRYLKGAVVATLVLLGCAASLSAASRKFPCNASGRVFRTTLTTNEALRVTLTWTKPTPDNDLALFDPASGQLLGIGVGIAQRYEFVAIGGLTGLPVDVLVIKASGENGQCILRWSQDMTDFGSSRPRRMQMRSLGSLDGLAARDPKYAEMRATLEEYTRLKRSRE